MREHLPTHLQEKFLAVPGGRGGDGGGDLVRGRVADAVARHVAQQSLDLLEGYAQERGQGKRAADGVADVVAALRKAQVETLLVTTEPDEGATLLFGPEPTQLGTTADELAALGVDAPLEGPLVDVLLRAALGTGAGVQVVPHELPDAPAGGVGAILRYADALGTARGAPVTATQRVWPGTAYPLGATFDGTGTNFALFSEVAHKVELCLFDADARRDPVRAPLSATPSSGTATCRTSGPASATATGCTGPTTRPTATGATRRSCCWTPTPRRSTATSTGPRPASPTPGARRTPATTRTRPRT